MSLDSGTIDTIREVVQEFTDQNKMFTAYDVSVATRVRATAKGLPFVRHNDMKEEIHKAMDQFLMCDAYDKSLQDVGAPTKAFVYFPKDGTDPANYVPQLRSGPTPTSAAPVVTPAAATPAAANDSDDGDGRKPDARGTVCIPNYLLRTAGFQPSDQAAVWSEKDGSDDVLCIGKVLPTGKNALASYTVDYHGNVRVTKSVLDSAGFGGVQAFDFEGDASVVKVRAH